MLRYRAQLALLADEAPDGEEWLHEVKYDGYRIGCLVEGERVRLVSRHEKDWTASFPEVAREARRLPARQALLDGEIAIVLPDGRTSFQALQNAFARGGRREGLTYFAFDLLHLDGEDVARLPLEERKARLSALLARLDSTQPRTIRYATHVVGNGPKVRREACRLGLEGIVSKRRDLPYQPGRHAGWVKTKCKKRQELVIGGFTDPEGSRQGIGALLVGYWDSAGALRFAGKVGTGFTQRSAQELRRKLEAMETDECPFTPRPAGWLGTHAHWVRPELVAEVAFMEWTADGKIRHPSFLGIRRDKDAREVVREEPRIRAPASPRTSPTAASSSTPRSRRRRH